MTTTVTLAQNAENQPTAEAPAAAGTDSNETGATETGAAPEAGAPGTEAAADATATDTAAGATDAAETGAAAETTTGVDAAPVAEDGQPVDGQTALPVDDLAELDQGQSVFWLGVIPVIVLGLFVLLWAVLSYWRQKKNWAELGKDLELSDDQPPITRNDDFKTGPSTDEVEKLPPTRQSSRLAKKKPDDED
jgi:hypothetical protein